MTAFMLPPAPGTCLICATKHEVTHPHNIESIFYGMRFQDAHGRAPTWYDAMAHLPKEHHAALVAIIRDICEEKGVPFRELPDGAEPISEPYQTSDDRDGNPAIRMKMQPIVVEIEEE